MKAQLFRIAATVLALTLAVSAASCGTAKKTGKKTHSSVSASSKESSSGKSSSKKSSDKSDKQADESSSDEATSEESSQSPATSTQTTPPASSAAPKQPSSSNKTSTAYTVPAPTQADLDKIITGMLDQLLLVRTQYAATGKLVQRHCPSTGYPFIIKDTYLTDLANEIIDLPPENKYLNSYHERYNIPDYDDDFILKFDYTDGWLGPYNENECPEWATPLADGTCAIDYVLLGKRMFDATYDLTDVLLSLDDYGVILERQMFLLADTTGIGIALRYREGGTIDIVVAVGSQSRYMTQDEFYNKYQESIK